jgi:hypothetical protein
MIGCKSEEDREKEESLIPRELPYISARGYTNHAEYYCPKLNGKLSYTTLQRVLSAKEKLEGGYDTSLSLTDVPLDAVTPSMYSINCSTDSLFCHNFRDQGYDPKINQAARLDMLFLVPKVIDHFGEYQINGQTVIVEKALDGSRPKNGFYSSAFVKVTAPVSLGGVQTGVLLHDSIGVKAISGLKATLKGRITQADVNGPLEYAPVDIGSCTFIRGDPLFSGVKIKIPDVETPQ